MNTHDDNEAIKEVREIAEQDEKDGYNSITERIEAERKTESDKDSVLEVSESKTITLEDFVESGENQDFFAGLGQDDDEDDKVLDAYELTTKPVIELKDGTKFYFRIPDLESERKADNLRKTLIITSPAKINGFNPTQETTDYAIADVRYFLDNLEKVKKVKLNAGDDFDPDAEIDAKTVVRRERGKDMKVRDITVAHLIPIKHARAAAGRIFGGKIEVEKPENQGEKILVLNEVRFITVKQEMGVEQNDDGTFTKPNHILRFIFREPATRDLSFWQTKCFLGFKIPIKGGGSREERYFNTDRTVELFDSMIERVEGATVGGVDCEVKNTDHLKAILWKI